MAVDRKLFPWLMHSQPRSPVCEITGGEVLTLADRKTLTRLSALNTHGITGVSRTTNGRGGVNQVEFGLFQLLAHCCRHELLSSLCCLAMIQSPQILPYPTDLRLLDPPTVRGDRQNPAVLITIEAVRCAVASRPREAPASCSKKFVQFFNSHELLPLAADRMGLILRTRLGANRSLRL